MRRAFTIVELLIALAIGTFVVAALYSLFTVQLRQFVYQDIQMEMHQSIRLGMDVLTRTGRAAGMGTNGVVYGALGTGASDANTLPAIISYDGTGPGGADAITIVSMDPTLVMYTDPDSLKSCSSTSISVDPSRGGYSSKLGDFASGEYLLCYDFGSPAGTRSLMWEISGAPDAAAGTIPVTGGAAYADFIATCPDSDNLPIGMECSRADVVTFYIDADDSDGIGAGSAAHPVLMMDLDFESPDSDDIPVVDNVEDMQIEYCFRTDLACSSGSWHDTVDTYADSSTDNDPDDIYMIRFTIVVRSTREDLNRAYLGAPLSIANNSPADSNDHYFRQVLSAEVTVRNMRGLN